MKIQGEVKDATCTQSQLGRALGVSKQRIGQLIEEKIVMRDESSTNGQVMLFESLQNYFLSKNTSGDGVNFWKEKGLHEKAKRELSELKLAKTRGELYEAADVDAAIAEMLTDCRNKLLGVGHKLATQLENKTAVQICAIIDEEIYQCLTELSEGLKEADFKEEVTIETEE